MDQKKNIENQYVAITANENSTFALTYKALGISVDLQYSKDKTNWSSYSNEISINQGQTLYLKGNNPDGWSQSRTVYSYLSIIGSVSINGNVMGLLDNGAKPGEEGDITTIPCDYCFIGLFENSTGIESVSEDFLPATTLAYGCYVGMFDGCTSLTAGPELPATTLTNGCYAYMFSSCSSLTVAPELPATSLEDGCYYSMFENCTSLTTAPELPATNLKQDCYSGMFYQCTSLTNAPKLSSMSLAVSCYQHMFNGCASLTTAPELPATTLADNCYRYMFYKCSSFNSIKIGYTGDYSDTYFNNWVTGVASSGTFYYNDNQTAQKFQLPTDWTKHSF
ncbi:MAG: leucine-rich repeat protein [Mycoplasma sp.]|nr:leucine-rich repeat protein [Mycoplasma sp.]